MNFFSRKKTPKKQNIRDVSQRVRREQHENTPFSSVYKQIIQDSMDSTVAPLLSDNSGTSEQVILNETENIMEQSIPYDNDTLLQSQPPIDSGTFEIQHETVTQPDTVTFKTKKNVATGLFLVVLFYVCYKFLRLLIGVLVSWEFLWAILLLVVGFAGGYLYLLISTIIGSSGSLQKLREKFDAAITEGAETAQKAYQETMENCVSLDTCLQDAKKAYGQFLTENNIMPSQLTPLNTEEMRQHICDAFAKAVSNEIMRLNSRRLERSDIMPVLRMLRENHKSKFKYFELEPRKIAHIAS